MDNESKKFGIESFHADGSTKALLHLDEGWVHCAVTHNSTDWQFYINGKHVQCRKGLFAYIARHFSFRWGYQLAPYRWNWLLRFDWLILIIFLLCVGRMT